MSKWKDKSVRIIQIFKDPKYSYSLAGLGDDSKVYLWDYEQGKWQKAWDTNEESDE